MSRRRFLAMSGLTPAAVILAGGCRAADSGASGGAALADPGPLIVPGTPRPVDRSTIPHDAGGSPIERLPASRPRDGRPDFGLDPYRGLGCWVDVFDWSPTYAGRGVPAISAIEIAALARHGVRTLYVQAARTDSPAGSELVDRDRLWALADAVHANGMAVVGWFLPGHVDDGLDLRRSLAVIEDRSFDGFALDIESRVEPDVALRNERLARLVRGVRAAVGPGVVLGSIVVPPTTMEDVNAAYWPGFDWALLAEQFDVFLPMNYWTYRLADSPWRDAAASTAENIRRLRRHAGRADYPVHVIGGLAAEVTGTEVGAMVDSVRSEGGTGASLYDLATTGVDLWGALGGLGPR